MNKLKAIKGTIFFFIFIFFQFQAIAQLKLEWANPIKGTGGGSDAVYAMKPDGQGNFLAIGSYEGTIDLDPGIGTKWLFSNGASDFYLAKFDSLGGLLWAKSIGGPVGDYPSDIALDQTGNIYITGSCGMWADFDPGPDTSYARPIGPTKNGMVFFAKYTPSGDFLWVKSMSGTTGFGFGAAIDIASNGDIFLAGNFKVSMDFDPSASENILAATGSNYYDIFLGRYSPTGNLIWVNKIGGSNYDEVKGLAVDKQDNVYISGYFMSSVDFNPGIKDSILTISTNVKARFVAAYNGSGNFRWVRTTSNIGEGGDIILDKSNRLQVVGYYKNTASSDFEYFSYQRYTTDGNVLKNISYPSQQGIYYNLCAGPNNEIYAAGYIESVSASIKNTVIAIDSNGLIKWEHYNSSTNPLSTAPVSIYNYAICFLGLDKIVYAGSFEKNCDFDVSTTGNTTKSSIILESGFFCCYSSSNTFKWAQRLEDNTGTLISESGSLDLVIDKKENGYMAITSKGRVSTNRFEPDSVFSSTFDQSLLVKNASNSREKWAIQFKGSANAPRSIALDDKLNLYVAGHFLGTVDFNPGAGVNNLTSLGGQDTYLAKLDSNGNYIWAFRLGGNNPVNTNSDMPTKVYFRNDKIYLLGQYQGNVDFDPSVNTFTLNAGTGIKNYAAIYDKDGNFILARSFDGTFVDMSFTSDHKLVMTGTYKGTTDFDFGTGVANLTAGINSLFSFVAAYDSLFNYKWVVKNGYLGDCNSIRILTNSNGQLFIAGEFNVRTELFSTDGSSQTIISSNQSNGCFYMACYNSSGKLQWVRFTDSKSTDDLKDFGLDSKGNLYICGNLANPIDFDMETGTNIITPFGTSHPDVFLASYTPTGSLLWVKSFSNFGTENFTKMAFGSNKMLVCGTGGSASDPFDIDFDWGIYEITTKNLIQYSLPCMSAPVVLAAPAVSRCGSGSVTLSAQTSGGQPSWYFSNLSTSSFASGNQVLISNLNLSRSYYVAVVTPGCPSNRIEVPVTINPLPIVSASSSAGAVCAGASVSLFGFGAQSYSWTSGVLNGVGFVPVSTQTYVVTGTDARGCTATASRTITVNPLPNVVALASSSSICAGNSITLNGSGASFYTWSGGVQNGVPFVASVSQRYVLTGTGSNGCLDTATVNVQVLPAPNVGIQASNTAVCPGGSISLSGTGAQSYAWSGGISDGVAFTPSVSQTYTVTGTATNGCTKTTSVVITVHPVPVVGFFSNVPNNQVCEGNSITLNGTGANSYTWSPGIQNGVPFTPTTSQTYIVTGISTLGCSDSATVYVPVLPRPVVGILGGGGSYCPGTPITLSGTGAQSYQWTGGITDGLPFLLQSTFTYSVTGTAINGCTKTANILITALPKPNVSIQSSASQICQGGSLTLTGIGANSYVWSGGVNNGLAFNPGNSSTYSVIGSNPEGCADTASISITVVVPEIPNISQNLNTLNSSITSASLFEWLDCNNGMAVIQGENEAFFAPGQNGNFAIKIEKAGCSSVSSCFQFVFTGVEQTKNHSRLSIFPIPAKSELHITGFKDKIETILIFDATGKLIQEFEPELVSEDHIHLNLNGFSSGMYWIKAGGEMRKLLIE